MCNPGTVKTDKELAFKARRYLQGLLLATHELEERGYEVGLVSSSSYRLNQPQSIIITKRVVL